MYLREILKTSSAEEAGHIFTILNTQRALSRCWVTNPPKTPSKEGISRPPFQRMAQFFSPLHPQVSSNCRGLLLIFSSRRRIRISPQKWGGGRGRWTLCRARIRCKMLKPMVVSGLLSPADSRGAGESCLVRKNYVNSAQLENISIQRCQCKCGISFGKWCLPPFQGLCTYTPACN